CYTCVTKDPKTCTKISPCAAFADSCVKRSLLGVTIKGCYYNNSCKEGGHYCETDLCNSAMPTGPSVILLLISSAIITLFL
uniref:UPAR/Ly6 domain-containing protein n=1 Tax=Lates calcarifer TaxID=8187 RepID=A0A4W6CA19_LATCA